MAKTRDKNFKKIVQGDWTLGHSDIELRENVMVGDKPLKDLKEEELAVIWEKKIGTHYFRQAVRREVVHRVSEYFKKGYEKVETINTKNKVSSVFDEFKPKDPQDVKVEEYIEKCKQQS